MLCILASLSVDSIVAIAEHWKLCFGGRQYDRLHRYNSYIVSLYVFRFLSIFLVVADVCDASIKEALSEYFVPGIA
jgi:hypothetical protein